MKMGKRILGSALMEAQVILGILVVMVALAVPKFQDSVERSKASEAYNFLSSVRVAQERYFNRQGVYANDLSKLDFQLGESKYFVTGEILPGETGSIENSWTLTLTRRSASSGYGAYTVTYGQEGFMPEKSSISALREINPMTS